MSRPTRFVATLLGTQIVLLTVLVSTAVAAWTEPEQLTGTAGNVPVLTGGSSTGDEYLFTAGNLNVHLFNSLRVTSGPVIGTATTVLAGFPGPTSGWWGAPQKMAISPTGRFIAAESAITVPTGGSLRVITGRLVAGIPTGVKVAKTITGEYARSLSVAINDRGDAGVLWATTHGNWSKTYVAFSKAGAAFGKTVTLSSATYRAAGSVALNSTGDSVIAWEQNRGATHVRDVRASIRTSSGRFTNPRIIGPTYAYPNVKLYLNAKRDAAISWFTQATGEGAIGGPLDVYVATLKASGALIAPTHIDHQYGAGWSEGWAVMHAQIRMLPESDGRQLILWSGWDGTKMAVYSRLTTSTEAVRVSPVGVNALLLDAATEPGGGVVATWITGQHGADGDGTDPVIGATLSADAGATWSAPETVAAGAGMNVSGVGEAKAMISGGKAVVFWGTDGNPYNSPLDPPLIRWSASPMPLGGE